MIDGDEGKASPTRDRAVVQTVRFGRALAIASALLALLAMAVAMTFVSDRVEVIIGAPLVGVIWGFGTIGLLSLQEQNGRLLMRIPADALPPKASLPMALIPSVALFTLLAAFLLSTLYWLPQGGAGVFLGMLLGIPIAQWGSVLRSKRAEHQLGGTLWMTPNIAWTSKGRDRYLALPE